MVTIASFRAGAETITGVFRYTYLDPANGMTVTKPIPFATVEVWSFRPRITVPLLPAIWTWDKDATVATDGGGAISVAMGNIPGTIYGLRVFADNYAASVYANKAIPDPFPFFSRPGEDDGAEIRWTTFGPLDVLNFDYTFHGWSAQHYSLAEAVRHAFDYATAHRDPREAATQPIPKANVQPTSLSPTGTFYDPVADRLIIASPEVFQDFEVTHEYAHFLENHISRFLPLPSRHDGCAATIAGAIVNSPEHAWMEGFADYFAAAVNASLPGVFHGQSNFGTAAAAELETPSTCAGLPSWVTPDAVELRVAGALWDLFDGPADVGSRPEPLDCLSRANDLDGRGLTTDMAIMQIFDFELERLPLLSYPTINSFSNAWVMRGLPVACFNRILSMNPSLNSIALTCPPDQIVTAAAREDAAVVNFPSPTANVSVPGVAIVCAPPSGSSFRVGTTTVACSARDAAGPLATCSFTVTVLNNPVSTPAGCPPQPMPAFYADFDFGLPPGARLYGTAQAADGILKLTTAQFNQLGSLVIDDFLTGAELTEFSATFKALVGGGTFPEADGFSFNFAGDLPNAPFGEEGAGTGLSVCFDNYDNEGGEAPAIDVKWRGNLVARKRQNPLTGNRFVEVLIRLHADGTLDVFWDGKAVFQNLATGYTPVAGGRFGLGGRTGALTSNHFIDDLGISVPQRTGLVGAYYDNADFSSFRFTRTDPAIDFDWSTASPHPSLAPDGFAVRWTGQIVPLYSEAYTFSTLSDDGVRLWVNNRLMVDNWTDHGTTENSGTIALVAGKPCDVRLEYYENAGGAVMKLLWSSPSQPKEIIPSRQLLPHPLAAAAICGLFNTGVDASGLPLPDDASDPHYSLIYRDGASASPRGWTPVAATAAGGFPIGPWVGDDNFSAWTAPRADTVGPNDYAGFGSYRYELHFDLSGQDPATAVLQGRWAVDNFGQDILLNGHSTGMANNAGFTTWTPFFINRGFVPGWNTLTFVVNNGYLTPVPDGPTGLRVEICGTAESALRPGALAAPSATEAGMALTFGSRPGHRYCLQSKPSLSATSWTTVQCVVASAYLTTLVDRAPSPTMGFYQVVEMP